MLDWRNVSPQPIDEMGPGGGGGKENRDIRGRLADRRGDGGEVCNKQSSYSVQHAPAVTLRAFFFQEFPFQEARKTLKPELAYNSAAFLPAVHGQIAYFS